MVVRWGGRENEDLDLSIGWGVEDAETSVPVSIGSDGSIELTAKLDYELIKEYWLVVATVPRGMPELRVTTWLQVGGGVDWAWQLKIIRFEFIKT